MEKNVLENNANSLTLTVERVFYAVRVVVLCTGKNLMPGYRIFYS